MERAPAGAKPGGTLGREVKIVADVIAVNPKHKTVTLRDPKVDTLDVKVEGPAVRKHQKG
jgi:hypothetical protein